MDQPIYLFFIPLTSARRYGTGPFQRTLSSAPQPRHGRIVLTSGDVRSVKTATANNRSILVYQVGRRPQWNWGAPRSISWLARSPAAVVCLPVFRLGATSPRILVRELGSALPLCYWRLFLQCLNYPYVGYLLLHASQMAWFPGSMNGMWCATLTRLSTACRVRLMYSPGVSGCST
ncbi:hypothetical protein BO86DRAFT_189140 [Aspergillus japonicus CBS 114.51]|uniref:Uncharacterized protein n=1 Tax=Aspergillus japonicus CBS 114.51 TaxID=1448312 RepID=A0A8T8XB89_ASPJA|nr:hypothetical protein BO86DRAFT_189140 [Aspergillus japonicus CBS 114.51]RAH85341.1 hypothetical protein BO86DRAFT_189140 [Aspergillus japonicus CBS 114.51]